MSDHFNNLSPAHHELLTKIFEEASEISQAVAKILLHGMDSYEPKNPAISNKDRLHNEIADLIFFVNRAADYGVLDMNEIQQALNRRSDRPVNYLHHVEI